MGGHKTFFVGLFAGVVVLAAALLLVSYFQGEEVSAQTSMGGGGLIAVTGKSQQTQDVLYVIDTNTRNMAVYTVSGRNLMLMAAREIKWDLKFADYNNAKPTPQEVFKKVSD